MGFRFVFAESGVGMSENNKQSGFTLVELVVVIVLLGILAAFAIPRFVDIDSFRVRAAYDEVAGAVRYAQKLAVVSGCEVQVVISANGYALQQHATDCNSGAFTNITDHPVTNMTFSDVSFSPAQNFTFDPMGRSSSGTTITVGGTKTLTIVAETGYVDAP